MSEAKTKILAARYKAARLRPYLANALWALHPVLEERVGTMGVDIHWRMYYSEKFVNKTPMDQLVGVYIHEVWHCLRQHAQRCRSMSAHPRVWNVAGDCEINDDMREEGIALPEDGLFPDKFGLPEGLTVEEYYHKLMEMGQDSKEGDGEGGEGLSPAAGNCGSCADGDSREWEQAPEKKTKDEEGNTKRSGTPSVTSAEADLIARDTARQIQEHVKNRGDVPAGIKRWADALMKPPQVDWRKQLATAIRASMANASGCVDYSYSRPSRRQAMSDVVLPSMRRPTPEVVVVVDTSGSMGADELDAAISEIAGILRSIGTTGVPVLSCDAAVGSIKRVASAKTLNLVGGGGTDMRVGMEAASKLHPRPDVVIVLTDGYTPWPDHRYRYKTVIGLIDYEREDTPSWAKVVHIKTRGRD